jgi:hypothetical protein
MPDARLRRTRATLPEGYQYGDGALFGVQTRLMLARIRAREVRERGLAAYCGLADARLRDAADAADRADDERDERAWRAPHENAAAQLTRQAQRTGEETI